MARRRGGCARHLQRLPGPRLCRRDRPVGAADGVFGRVYGGEMGRRGLSLFTGVQMLLSRRPVTAVAADRQRGRRCAGVLAGRADQRAQSEGGAVLPRLPAAIRGGGFAHKALAFLAARPDLHFQRHAVVPRRRRVRGTAASRIRQSAGRWPGSIARSAGCSSISASASRCWRALRPSALSREACTARCRRDRARAGSSRSGTSGGTLPAASASAPPVR